MTKIDPETRRQMDEEQRLLEQQLADANEQNAQLDSWLYAVREITERVERQTAEKIAAWVLTQEDQDGCGDDLAAGILEGKWKP